MKRRVKKLAALLLAFAVVVTFIPVTGLQTAYAESKEIQISDGEFKISELIDEQSLAHGDTLEIGANTVLDVDVAFSLDKIVATTGSAGLTLKGDQFLEQKIK